MRYFLDIAYKGTNYHGWQLQQNAHSVQAELDAAIQKIFGKQVETTASGRTDTGVHAEQQIVHLDLSTELNDNHIFKLNCILPNDIAIKDFYPVQKDAHARFDATLRAYEYRICREKNPFFTDNVYFFDRPLDLVKMNEAADVLLYHKDFESLSKVHTEVKNFLCEIFFAHWREKNNMVYFEIEANRFLRGMVRTLVGSMLPIGMGKSTVEEFEQSLLAKDRRKAGPAAPAEGLFLTRVEYPESVYLK